VWHPRGPERTEIWSWLLLDKTAPDEIKNVFRRDYIRTFGPGGIFEQDDMDNWGQTSASGRGWISRQHFMNLQMGLGHEIHDENLPGLLGHGAYTEVNQRAMYARWAEMIGAEDWSKIPIAPRTLEVPTHVP
jgi:hypothetical protein